MDQAVQDAMKKWPNVPAVKGWLALTRRGQWLIYPKGNAYHAATDGERITNKQITAFISRNYTSTSQGEWFFQNGPQRVYVYLEVAPWVLHISDAHINLHTHTEIPVQTIHELLISSEGDLFIHFNEHQIGILLDRDLSVFINYLEQHNPHLDLDQLPGLSAVSITVPNQDKACLIKSIKTQEIATTYGFINQP